MDRIIIHVDMDAFYAAVEVRDNPELAGKPLIIGALPGERGVVSTCSYEAREFGVHSAMSIKEAYRRCPQGIYMHPNMPKYKKASNKIHEIWCCYTNIVEYISLDEGYLDITGSAHLFGGARKIAEEIKSRTRQEVGLTCSVGIGYNMTSAKMASEEKKPDGLFEIPTPHAFVRLILDRNVRVLFGVGKKTAEKLEDAGIRTVRDVRENRSIVHRMLGKHGKDIVSLADGIDNRVVTPYYEEEAKSIGREHTFQEDITDFDYLKAALRLLARDLSNKIRFEGLYARTITLKITYYDMKQITRARSGNATNQSNDIYTTAAQLLDGIEKKPIRLIGISLSNLSETKTRQLSLADIWHEQANIRQEALDGKLLDLQRRFGTDIIKTGSELDAENRLAKTDDRSKETDLE
ncbi:MAG: DNA polymerase IV [Christensenellaceae bacterium]|jgi:nucleotidyltransferase/DNA polymerase involved in DNA repair